MASKLNIVLFIFFVLNYSAAHAKSKYFKAISRSYSVGAPNTPALPKLYVRLSSELPAGGFVLERIASTQANLVEISVANFKKDSAGIWTVDGASAGNWKYNGPVNVRADGDWPSLWSSNGYLKHSLMGTAHMSMRWQEKGKVTLQVSIANKDDKILTAFVDTFSDIDEKTYENFFIDLSKDPTKAFK